MFIKLSFLFCVISLFSNEFLIERPKIKVAQEVKDRVLEESAKFLKNKNHFDKAAVFNEEEILNLIHNGLQDDFKRLNKQDLTKILEELKKINYTYSEFQKKISDSSQSIKSIVNKSKATRKTSGCETKKTKR